MTIDGRVAIHERPISPWHLSEEAGAEFILPAAWTTKLKLEIDSIRDMTQTPKFADDSDLLNSSWQLHTPTFLEPTSLPVITIQDLQAKDLKAYKIFPGEELVLLGAIVILTLLTLINTVLFLVLNSKFKFVVAEKRSRQSAPLAQQSVRPAQQANGDRPAPASDPEAVPLQSPRQYEDVEPVLSRALRRALPPPPNY